jgi:hypothetical protein
MREEKISLNEESLEKLIVELIEEGLIQEDPEAEEMDEEEIKDIR